MIDWISVLFNSLWIGGLSIILAAFSYQHWLAGLQGHSLREQLQQRSFALWGWSGLTLGTIGLAGTSSSIWETVIWILFSVLNTFFVLQNWRQNRADSSSSRPQ